MIKSFVFVFEETDDDDGASVVYLIWDDELELGFHCYESEEREK